MSNYSLKVLLVLVMAVGAPSLASAQVGAGGGGMGGFGGGAPGIGMVPGTAYGGATDPTQVALHEGWLVIPAITGAQRYDSNVFFIPKTPGQDRSDYVTTVMPQVRALYSGSAFKLNANVGAVSEYYAINNGLSYVGVNAGLSLDASPILDRLWKGMRLMVTDNYMYTPQPPSFMTGDLEGDSTNPFTRGLQVGRVNTSTNTVNSNLQAPLSSSFSLTGMYTYSTLKFGQTEVQQIGSLFDTVTQTFSVGVMYSISLRDSVGMNYVDTQTSFQPSSAGSFSTRGGTVVWNHAFSPTLTMMTTAGVQVLEGSSQFPGGTTAQSAPVNVSVPSTLVPSGGFTLMSKERATTWTLNYTTMVTPSFLIASTPVLAHTVSLAATQPVGVPELVGFLSVNYARGDPYGSTSGVTGTTAAQGISYQTVGGGGGLSYRITPKAFLSLNYAYANFDNKFQGQKFSFDRHVVSLAYSQAFY